MHVQSSGLIVVQALFQRDPVHDLLTLYRPRGWLKPCIYSLCALDYGILWRLRTLTWQRLSQGLKDRITVVKTAT